MHRPIARICLAVMGVVLLGGADWLQFRGNHGNGAKAKDGAHGPHARRGAPGQGGARRQPFRRFVVDSHNRRGRVRAHADDADRRTVKPLFLLLCLVRRDIGVVVNRIENPAVAAPNLQLEQIRHAATR